MTTTDAARSSAAKEGDYILGTDREELERLGFQHEVWVKEQHALLERAGLRAGQSVLDLGCGPGFTSLELAAFVGPGGRVVARDQSRPFVEHLKRECERRGLLQIEPSLGPVEELSLAPASLDALYSRWLLCWLPDPAGVLERVTRALRSGGVVLLQEYLDWGAKKLVPRSASHDRVVEACMRSWREGGATIDLAEHVHALSNRAGLALEHFRPIARLGRVGSMEWRWLDGFYRSYLPRLVARGLLEPGELAAFETEWKARAAEGTSYCVTPTMADVILRKTG
jgi:ubiquinone/menaquinone biosynthesis C-methylase UbiE